MYSIKLHGVAGPEPDLSKVRVYVNGGSPTEVPVTANAGFDVTVQSPSSGNVLVEHSFVDTSGQESARYQQTVAVPDLEPPARPTAPLQIVSVVWG